MEVTRLFMETMQGTAFVSEVQTVVARGNAEAVASHRGVLSSLAGTAGVSAAGEAVAGWGRELGGAADEAAGLAEQARRWVRTLSFHSQRYRGFVKQCPDKAEARMYQDMLNDLVGFERISLKAVEKIEAEKETVDKSVSFCKGILDKMRKKWEEEEATGDKVFSAVTLFDLSFEVRRLDVDAEYLIYKEILDEKREAEAESRKTENSDKMEKETSSSSKRDGERVEEGEEEEEEEDEDSMIRRVATREKIKELNWLD